jgi:glycosyltransferase involved in cell wall biosynthesis
MVANQKWYKRQELFLRSIRVVVSTYPSMRAILVGDGPDHDSLIGLARKLGIDQNVEFVGRALDVRPYLAKAHLVALTSTHEGFPNALLEGMAMGRPVVATRVGGIPELVREGTDGLLVDPDPEALANSMLSIVGNRSRLESMSRNAIARAHQFGWDRLVREMEDAYREVRVARNRKQRRGTPSPQPR